MFVGIDVGGTKALAVLAHPASGAVGSRRRVSSAGTADQLAEALAALVEGLAGESVEPVEGVGLGVAGLAHRSGVVRYSPNLPSLVEYPLAAAVETRTGLPVVLGNDATTGALAEWRHGAARGCDDVVYLALGTGIGTGFVVGGRLVEGANGFAGESGHMVVDVDGPDHLTGQQGPWEYFASGTALGRLGRQAAASGRLDLALAEVEAAEAVTGADVVHALRAGDAGAAKVFDEYCGWVALGAANLVLILDPERIVLGGGLVEVGEPLRAGVDRRLREVLLGADHRPAVDIRLAELGVDAAARGAALLAAERSADSG